MLAHELGEERVSGERQHVKGILRAHCHVTRLVADERLALLRMHEEAVHLPVLLTQRLHRRRLNLNKVPRAIVNSLTQDTNITKVT